MAFEPLRAAFLAVYLLSGTAALLYEVVWSRALTLHMGHTMAAVSTVLAAFMGGLALGAAAAGRVAPAVSPVRALRVYAALEAAIALCAWLLPFGLIAVRPLLAWTYADGAGGWVFGLSRVASSLILVFVPAAAMGATFPMAVRWFAGRIETAGADVGGLYAVNTMGSAAGAAATGFFLLPALGLRGTTLVGMTLNIVAALGALGIAARAAAATAARAAPAARVGVGPRPNSEMARGAAARGDSPEPMRGAKPPSISVRGWGPARPETSAPRAVKEARGGRRRSTAARAVAPGFPWLASGAAMVSGFVALVSEVAWTRTLALVIGPTTYAFTAMLAVFIGGLALGSALAARLASRLGRPALALSLALVVTAAGTLTAATFIDDVTLAMAREVASPEASFGDVVWYQTGVMALLLVPMTVGLGAVFPFAVAVAVGEGAAVSARAALVYALNTAGAIAGALTGGFVFLPWLGLQHTILGAALLAAAGAVLVAVRAERRTRFGMVAIGLAVTTTVIVPVLPRWNRELLASGAYKYAPYLHDADLESGLSAGQMLYYAEGASGTVAVRRVAGSVSLSIDGKVDATNSGDMLTQKLLAHLPLLLHPGARDVAIIGLGSGVTLGAALSHPVRQVDVLEISPEVVEASSFFARENDDALSDPRARLIVGDGRSHLLLSRRTYDVIISEPSNPWMAGVATLFTREFFDAARQRLAPGGLLCQWAHTYDISDADLRSVVATFHAVFPAASVWLVGEGDLLLIGASGSIDPALDQLASRWNHLDAGAALASVRVRDSFGLLSLFVASGADLESYVAGARVQTDDHTSLEFSAPRSIYGRSAGDALAALEALAVGATRPAAVSAAFDGADGGAWRNRGLMLLEGAEAYQPAFAALVRAVDMGRADDETLDALVRAAAGARRQDEASDVLRRRASADAQAADVRVALSRLRASAGAFDEAIRWAEEARAIAPASPVPLEQLASIYMDVQDVDRLASIVAILTRDAPDRPDTRYYEAALHFLRGDFPRAAALAERFVAEHQTHYRGQNLLGAAYGTLGQTERARRAFETSVKVNPREPLTYVNLGIFELESGQPAAAARSFAEALVLDPQSVGALSGLAEALARQGHTDRAARIGRLLGGRL